MEEYCTVGQATDDHIIWRMRIPCCIINATNTHSEYVITIASPRQKWLHERASVLSYTHVHACIVDKMSSGKQYTATVT